MKEKKKKVTVIIISILIVLILLLAIAYAYFSTQLSGTDQIVKVGELELVLDETSEGISLDSAIGISDKKGLELDGSNFKLINNGNKAVDYTIYLDDNTIGDNDERIDDKYLKYNLNKNGADSGATLLTKIGSNPNRVLDSGTIEGKSTNKYKLNLWITDEIDGDYSGQVFSGKLRVEVSQARETVAEVLLADSANNINTDDTDQTFITGSNPNNYIWYSGKLWRAVSINNEEKTVKLVTQWNISTVNYDDDSSAFAGSYMEMWLNDTTVDGFLCNLRDYENFIVTDSVWDVTENDTSLGAIRRPNGGATVTDAVGLLNIYEYQTSYKGTTFSNGYLNNGLMWRTLTPSNSSSLRYVNINGTAGSGNPSNAYGIRPSINLKSKINIVSGNGTVDNPYRLEGDNDTNLSGTLLSSRYSGEYVQFGNDENNLYRIVSHETDGLTKITSAKPLKSSGSFITSTFGSNNIYSNTSTVGRFLNTDYLTNYVGDSYSNMIEDSTTWYLGAVGSGQNYRLAKYTDETGNTLTSSTTIAKVGLLRLGELMSGQFDRYENNVSFWLVNPYSSYYALAVGDLSSSANTGVWSSYGIKPSLNLKSNVIITSGDGTLQNPFEIELG